ncbi:unnamed protein product [Microthlaspi erraticum]|uniref:Uncharacterized protein n=1 Tax=Microthlaspi erraticum TaxID=1685480 RepID=A0A6D2KPF2_9BRAS|nr:unnamed protein product [Microthlaspi erraticum]
MRSNMVSPAGMPQISGYVSTDNMVTVQHDHERFMTSDTTIWESTFPPPSFTDMENEFMYTSVQLQMQQQDYASRQNLDPAKNPHEQYVP